MARPGSPNGSPHAPEPCDLILATSLLDLADLRGLLPPPLDRRPLVLYMHENQITYPLSPHEKFDFHFGFANIVSCLAADAVVFNSAFHRDLFLESLPAYLSRMPEAVPPGLRERIGARSHVLPVGLHRTPHEPPAEPCGAAVARRTTPGRAGPRGERPLILWNHRWEFDKRPQQFVSAIDQLLAAGLDFDVVLLGDDRHHATSSPRCGSGWAIGVLHAGFLPDRERYEAWLAAADIVVSCADQEYFGISVAEAVHAGCYPVLPRRQVYPHLYGPLCRGRHFYDTDQDLVALLGDLVRGEGAGHVCPLSRDVDAFCWPRLAPCYDALLARSLAREGGPHREPTRVPDRHRGCAGGRQELPPGAGGGGLAERPGPARHRLAAGEQQHHAPPDDLVAALAGAGFAVTGEHLVGALTTGAALLRREGWWRLGWLGAGKIRPWLEAQGFTLVAPEARSCDVVVLGVAPELRLQQVDQALRWLQGGAALVCLHRNRFWLDAEGRERLGPGALAAALEAAAPGTRTVTAGKPEPAVYGEALESLGVNAGEALFISDDPFTDLVGARRLGLATVFVLSGKYRDASVLDELAPTSSPT